MAIDQIQNQNEKPAQCGKWKNKIACDVRFL